MNIEGIIKAFKEESPVQYNGITYKNIVAIVYRKRKGRIVPQVELMDKTGHCIVVADPNKVSSLYKYNEEITKKDSFNAR